MAGITRIKIVGDGWDDWRTRMSDELAPAADRIYRAAFPLLAGLDIVRCTKSEAMARYDWKEGIDVILTFSDNTRGTLQEKFLTYDISTATIEERKGNGEQGAWYYCTAQYYFWGYARKYKRERLLEFQDWLIADLPALHRADREGLIDWRFGENRRDGRRATFRYVHFNDLPLNTVVARFNQEITVIKSGAQFYLPI